MMDWSSLSLVDASSTSMLALLFFYDHLMSFVSVILLFTLNSILFQWAQPYHGEMGVSVNFLEASWTITPALILLAIAIPSLQTLYATEFASSCALSFKTLGNQWFWTYDFGQSCETFSSYMLRTSQETAFRLLETDNYLVLPRGVWVRNLISSNDVIHSWALPSAGVKVDAVPGRINQTSLKFLTAGLVFGQCSEICGANHSFMPISVQVL